MTHKKALTIIFLFLITYSNISCIKQIQLDLPTVENKPVVNCLFCKDSIFKVQISEVSPIIGNSEAPIIEDAKCELYSDNIFLEKLVFKNGFYYSEKTIAEAGKNYTLKINTSLGNVEATSYVPKYSPNISVEHKIFTGEYSEWILAGDQPSTLSFTFKDNQNLKEYYECFMEIRELYRDSLDNLHYEEYSKEMTPLIASNEIFIKSESILEYRPKIIPFTDSLFDGQNITANIYYVFQSPETGLLYYNLTYHFRQTSRELYLYRKSLIKHIYAQPSMEEGTSVDEALFSEIGSPITLYSNIKNGYGIFAGYAEEKDTLLIIYEGLK